MLLVGSEATSADRSSYVILVVEDEVIIRMDVSDALRRHGYSVLEAANADEALRILRSGVPVSVVFTDVRMPGRLDGVGLAQHVGANHPAIQCIITSGHLSPSELPDPPPGTLIPKPYLLERVVAEIERVLLPRSKERDRQVK